MESLNFVDIIFLIIFLMSVVVGFGRGFLGEFLSLATLILAAIIAIHFAVPLANVFTSSPTVQNAINQASGTNLAAATQTASYFAIALSFTLLFIGVIIVGAILRAILNLAFTSGILGFGNRILGAFFGLVKGYLYNLILIFIIQMTPFGSQSWWLQSYFVQTYQPQVQWLAQLVSPTLSNLKNTFQQNIENMTNSLQSMVNVNPID